jgi:predicted acylesterase/phospholipase RssA
VLLFPYIIYKDFMDHTTSPLKGKHISLCLGGGGARGFIHIGVLRYLEQQGVVIDEISGNSM